MSTTAAMKLALEEQLIMLVHGKTELYDTSSKSYKNEQLKSQTWNDIAEMLEVEGKKYTNTLIQKYRT
jgi:hypothetical protein